MSEITINKNCEVLTEILEKENINFSLVFKNSENAVFELLPDKKTVYQKMSLCIEAKNAICRVEAYLDVKNEEIDREKIYRTVVAANVSKRIGAAEFDERDGTVSYRYAFPISHGIYEDEIKKIILSVSQSSSDCFEEILKAAIIIPDTDGEKI